MNTKIIKPNLKEKQISSLRKKVLSKKTSSPDKRIERREKIQILKNFLKNVDREKYSNKDLVLFLKKMVLNQRNHFLLLSKN